MGNCSALRASARGNGWRAFATRAQWKRWHAFTLVALCAKARWHAFLCCPAGRRRLLRMAQRRGLSRPVPAIMTRDSSYKQMGYWSAGAGRRHASECSLVQVAGRRLSPAAGRCGEPRREGVVCTVSKVISASWRGRCRRGKTAHSRKASRGGGNELWGELC